MKSILLNVTLSLSALIILSACNTTKPAQTDEDAKKIATAKINDQLGVAYLEQHNIERAKQKFLLALEEAPTIPDTWYSMGYFLEVTGEKAEAKNYYLKSIKLGKDRGDVQNNYGTFLCRSGEYQAAITHFELAAKNINYVDTAAAYENAGLCALKIPNKSLASYYFNKALLANPDRSLSDFELAKINYDAGNYKKSKAYLEDYLSLASPTPEVFRLSDQLDKKLGEQFSI